MKDDYIHELIVKYKKYSLIRSMDDDGTYITEFLNQLDDGIAYGEQYASSIFGKKQGDNTIIALDIGCSHGAMTAGIANHRCVAKVVGIEIEKEAVELANGLKEAGYYKAADNLEFTIGKAEKLPFRDESFDYIFCHTVIEHVNDVEKCIAEMKRCLKNTGEILISAPNYRWFMEPHLKVPMIPGTGKGIVKLTARCLNKNYRFIDTLQFVTPGKIESILRQHQLSYENLSLKKYYSILVRMNRNGLSRQKAYPVIKLIYQLKLGKLFFILMGHTGIYPSISYRVSKKQVV